MAEYGSSAVKNRVRPGGDLGSNQYFYTTDTKTGEITVNRYEGALLGGTKIGTIPQGGNFNVESKSNGDPVANTAEILYWADKSNVGKTRSSALKIARREWDGKTMPPPNTAIYGENAINRAYGSTNSNGGTESYTTPENLAASQQPTINQKLPRTGHIHQPRKSFKGPSGPLVYPIPLRTSGQDYLKMDMMEYAPKKMEFSEGNLSGFGRREHNRKIIGTVCLPIAGGIQDSNSVSWGDDRMDPLAAAAAQVALGGIMKGLGEAGSKAQDIADAVTAGKGQVRTALGTAIAGQVTGGGTQLLQRTTGQVINPNMELLFKDPSLRPFNFTWKLAPRSAQEAKTVIAIIRFFKQGMAPGRSESNLFLKSPHTFKLTYKHRNNDHKYLNKFKECALTSFTTQYAPDGNYATYEDGVMTAYQITMGFKELEPVFSNDYGDGFDEIGY